MVVTQPEVGDLKNKSFYSILTYIKVRKQGTTLTI